MEIFLQQLDGYRKPDLYDEREGGVWSVYFQTQGVRELFHTLSENHDVTMIEPLCHQPYGQTESVIRDPNGYTLVPPRAIENGTEHPLSRQTMTSITQVAQPWYSSGNSTGGRAC